MLCRSGAGELLGASDSAVCIALVALFDPEYRFVEELAYYSLTSWGAVHSGDIVDAPTGAAEFIDLDIDVMRKRGIRYVAATLTASPAKVSATCLSATPVG